ncbi:ion channel [Vibrio owensii]
MHMFRRIYLLCTVHLHRISWPALIVGTIAHYFICWVALSLAGEHELAKLPQFYYYMSVVGSTVGFGDMSPTSTIGQQFVAWYQIPASIGVFGAVLAKLVATTKAFIERNINGMRDFSQYTRHVIIIGWHGERTQKLIDCILADERRQNGQILLCVRDQEMTHPMPQNSQVDFARVSCFSDEDELKRIATDKANRVIIFGESDDQTLTAALAISPNVNEKCHIVAYFNDEKNAALPDKHCLNVECGSNRSAEMLARSMQDPGSSRIMSQLLNPQTGATQYALMVPCDAKPVSVKTMSRRMKADKNATLIAISTMQSGDDVELNPSNDKLIMPGHYIHYIASERILNDELTWEEAA